VKWTESVGLTLLKRDLNSMTLRSPDCRLIHFTILQLFPFTSESKRMGIVVRVHFFFNMLICDIFMCILNISLIKRMVSIIAMVIFLDPVIWAFQCFDPVDWAAGKQDVECGNT